MVKLMDWTKGNGKKKSSFWVVYPVAILTLHLPMLRYFTVFFGCYFVVLGQRGTLDTSFGNNGLRLHNFGSPGDRTFIGGHIFQSRTLSLASGFVGDVQNDPSGLRVYVARFLYSTGELDPSFAGGAGVRFFQEPGQTFAVSSDVVVQNFPNRRPRIVVSSYFGTAANSSIVKLIGLNEDGSDDLSFGGGAGFVVLSPSAGIDEGHGLDVDINSFIYLCGTANGNSWPDGFFLSKTQSFLSKFDPNGIPVPTFGTAGTGTLLFENDPGPDADSDNTDLVLDGRQETFVVGQYRNSSFNFRPELLKVGPSGQLLFPR